MRRTPCLDLYHECLLTGKVKGGNGLCYSGLPRLIGDDVFKMVSPTREDCENYGISRVGYWYDEGVDDFGEVFNKTRQNIVLLLACLNNEL